MESGCYKANTLYQSVCELNLIKKKHIYIFVCVCVNITGINLNDKLISLYELCMLCLNKYLIFKKYIEY